jgi:type IV pilus assembly protein PilB
LLFSTLHTNDAPGTITRLFDLDVEAPLIASSLSGILAQRLVRRICPACVAEVEPSPEVVDRLGGADALPAGQVWRAGRGCPACKQSGYKGRAGIHELLEVTGEIRALIAREAPEDAIREAARRAGMRTLAEDGIAKAAEGITTLDEVARVAPRDDLRASPAPAPPPLVVPSPPRTELLAAAPALPVNGSAPAAECGPARILVVEDSPTMVHVVSYFLQLEGYAVEAANDGEQGLAAARRQPPHLIVSDVDMPRMNGFEMVRALRADPLTSEIPILMLTARNSIENETEGLATGADDYVAKPVEPRRLAARVKRLLRRTGRGGPAAALHEAGAADESQPGSDMGEARS